MSQQRLKGGAIDDGILSCTLITDLRSLSPLATRACARGMKKTDRFRKGNHSVFSCGSCGDER